jgi:hypothetical protein
MTNDIEQSHYYKSWQEIPRLYRNSKVHYHVYKGTVRGPTFSQPNPIYILTQYFETHFNIILFASVH